MDHQIGQDQGGRAAEPHRAVDEHFTYRSVETKAGHHFLWIISELSHLLPAPGLYLQPCNDWIIVVHFILTV